MARKIGLKRVHKETLATIKERGEDYEYPQVDSPGHTGCHYTWAQDDVDFGIATSEQIGQPACLVGGVFARLDILDELGERENAQSVDMLEVSEKLDTEAVFYLDRLQLHQDSGTAWGEAEALAREATLEMFREAVFE